jgi:hypothetical protein
MSANNRPISSAAAASLYRAIGRLIAGVISARTEEVVLDEKLGKLAQHPMVAAWCIISFRPLVRSTISLIQYEFEILAMSQSSC